MSSQEVNSKKKRKPATCVRFTENEFKRVERMVQATGLSIPDLLKGALFERVDLVQPLLFPEVAQQLVLELKRQGNNINQIAKEVNSGLRHGWTPAFNNLVRAYMDLRHVISTNRVPR